MRLPRDLSGADLAARLTKLGYRVTRQTGAHLRLTTERDSEHHITIPNHRPSESARLLRSSRTSVSITASIEVKS